MTDTTSQLPKQLCKTCKAHFVSPYQNGTEWIYPDECPDCWDAWFLDWTRRMNEEIDKIRRIINQRKTL